MLYQKEIDVRASYDLIVCGGGFSGFAAAFAAAREGLRTLLIERNYNLGGVGTSALVNHILGERYRDEGGVHTCVAGLFARLENELVAEGNAVDYRTVSPDDNPHGWKASLSTGLIFDNEAMKRLLEKMLAEAGAAILYGTDLVDVLGSAPRPEGVIVHNKSGLYGIRADRLIDATGDGDLCALAGCRFDAGDEEGGLAAASLEMHVENVDTAALRAYMKETGDLRFTRIIGELKEKGIWRFPYEIFISVLLTRPGVYMINTIRQTGIDVTDAASLTRGVLEGRKESEELLGIMRAHFPGFGNAVIRATAPVIGIRETRRIRTAYTLTVRDLIEATPFADSVALSGYSWDMPHPKNPSYQPYHGVKRKSRVTEIPYRCLLPEGLENVLVVGRSVGVEREALGVVRVMGPCIAMGEAAGVAARLAAEKSVPFAAVDPMLLRARIRAHGGLVSRDEVR